MMNNRQGSGCHGEIMMMIATIHGLPIADCNRAAEAYSFRKHDHGRFLVAPYFRQPGRPVEWYHGSPTQQRVWD